MPYPTRHLIDVMRRTNFVFSAIHPSVPPFHSVFLVRGGAQFPFGCGLIHYPFVASLEIY